MPDIDVVKKVRSIRQNPKPVIGCFPLYPPLELIHAMGFFPIVLWGLKKSVPQTAESDRHLQPYVCSVGRHLTQFLLSEGRDLIDGIFMYNACDTLRNLPEIFMNEGLTGFGKTIPVIRMHIPMAPTQQRQASAYFENEICSTIESFQKHFGASFSADRFAHSVHLYNRMKKLAHQAQAQVAEGNLSFLPFAKTMMDGWFVPVEEQIEALESLLAGGRRFATKDFDGNRARPGVIISGILPPPESLISAIEKAGLTIVANDIAAMGRFYAHLVETPTDPAGYYKKKYFEHHPCPTLLYTGDRRLGALTDLIDQSGAAGVIFVGEKFCEYEYFEFPCMEKALKKKGIRTLRIEVAIEDEDQTAAHHARIEAFAEMLK